MSAPTAGAPALSIVMPAHDEEGNLCAAVREALEAATPLVKSLELLVVDDGSRDRTGALADALAREDPRVRVLHRVQGGHGPALITGLDAARGTWLLLLDADRQVPLDDLPRLWEEAHRGDGLLGIRTLRDDPRVRRLVSWGMRGWLRLLFAVRIADAGTPFKILPTACWREVRDLLGNSFPVPAVALAVHAVRTRDIVQHPVPHRSREHGQSSLRGGRLVRFALQAGLALLGLRVRMGRRGRVAQVGQ